MPEPDRKPNQSALPRTQPARPKPQMIDWVANFGMVILVGILFLIAIATILIFVFMYPWK